MGEGESGTSKHRVMQVGHRSAIKVILRDALSIFALTFIGAVYVGMAASDPANPMRGRMAAAAANFLLAIVGFSVSGYLAPRRRWKHLLPVAACVWLFTLASIAAFGPPVGGWFVRGVSLLVAMGIGGAIAFALRKDPGDAPMRAGPAQASTRTSRAGTSVGDSANSLKVAAVPPVPATDKLALRNQKYGGLALVILGFVLFGLGFTVAVPAHRGEILGIGWLLSGIGLASYARGSGRSAGWGLLLGLYPPFLGPLIGLLAFARNKKLESKTGLSDSALKWNVLLYAACLVLAALLAPRALWSKLFLRENDIWSALANDGMGISIMFQLMLALFLVWRLLSDIDKAGVSPGWRRASAWLVVRTVLVGLVIAISWSGLMANKSSQEKADSLIEESLGRIRPGMERAVVHQLILEANASLLPKPHALSFTASREEAAWGEVRNALKISQEGGQVDFQKMHGIFFHSNEKPPLEDDPEQRNVYETLDASIRPGTSMKDPEHREIFTRNCCVVSMFQWTRYDLFIEYDPDDHLKSVRYLKSRHGDGTDTSCYVRLEIPAAKNQEYPYPCPSDVQNF